MKISVNTNKGKIDSSASLALQSYKLGTIGVEKYAKDMMGNTDRKQDFFIWEIDKILTKSNKILKVCDVWCCSGALIWSIKKHFRERIIAVWVDISPDMIHIAKNSHQWIEFHTGNAYHISWLQWESIDILMWSSLLHELGSYNDDSYTHESYDNGIKIWLTEAERILSRWGSLLIKDPVKPIRPNESLILKKKCLWSSPARMIDITNIQLLKNNFSSPSEIPITDRIGLFLNTFRWNKGNVNIGEDTVSVTRALTSEIARHIPLPISDTWEHFIDEQREWYGSWNYDDWSTYDTNSMQSLRVNTHSAVFSTWNHAAKLKDDFELMDLNGEILSYDELLPTHQFTTLIKN